MKKLHNIVAPLTVSMVVITLGAAFGVLSGRGAFIGMASTSIVTLVTALISGSRFGVTTLTAPMTAALSVIMLMDKSWLETHHSDLDLVSLVNLTLIFAALILFVMTVCRVHRLIKLVPNLVISGFVNGIALLIVLAQFKSVTTGADWGLMLFTFVFAVAASLVGKEHQNMGGRLVSSALTTIILVSVIASVVGDYFSYIDFSTENWSLAVVWPNFSLLNFETVGFILPLAAELALIALLDTLLTAIIIDKKTRTRTKLTRELSGQGLAMLGVSLIGGVPGAQSTVPSMMMVQEKANDRFAKLWLALFCIIFTFAFSSLLQFVPLAVFGGIILKIAYDIADFTALKALLCRKSGHPYLRIFIAIGTCLSTVLLSLNLAVIGFTLIFVLWNQIMPKKWQIIDLKTGQESEGLIDEV